MSQNVGYRIVAEKVVADDANVDVTNIDPGDPEGCACMRLGPAWTTSFCSCVYDLFQLRQKVVDGAPKFFSTFFH